jgi:integration host factor subunit beta
LRCTVLGGVARTGVVSSAGISETYRLGWAKRLWRLQSGRRGMGTMTKQPTLTKADLIAEVERITELKRSDSEVIVETIFESIIDSLQKGDKIEIRGFGSFRTRQRRGRVGRNPKTGAKVEVPPKKIPFFKPSKELKDFVNTSNGDASVAGGDGAHS